jgi:hypothetical protein
VANKRIEELTAQLKDIKEKYRPGLGEIMASIQTHHAKLWFAGINQNWKLAEYEIKELKERFQNAQDIETNRIETGDLPMVNPSLDSMLITIQQKNLQGFQNVFQSLTNSCNNCHKAVKFEFNVVTIPTAPPVTNQDFKIK